MSNELFSRRNTSECLSAAWLLLSTNVKRIIKKVWVYALLFSLASAVSCVLMVRSMTAAVTDPDMVFMYSGPALWIMLIGYILIDAASFRVINQQSMKYNLWRSVKLLVVFFIVALISVMLTCAPAIGIVLWGLGKASTAFSVASTIAFMVGMLLYFILLTPMMYVIPKYMVEPEDSLMHVWKNYRSGMRHIGGILKLIVVCMLIMLIVYTLTGIPSIVCIGAATASANGMAAGDAAGLPTYFMTVLAVTSFASALVISIVQVWMNFALYYLYASIEVKNGRVVEGC